MQRIGQALSLNRKKIMFLTLAVVILAAIVFVSASIISRASSNVILFEAESATLSGRAKSGTDVNASGGKYAFFAEPEVAQPPTQPNPPADQPTNGIVKIKPNTRFAWQLQGKPNESVLTSESGPKVFDFDHENSSKEQIASIKAKGIVVICYFSAGTAEDWRQDYNKFKSTDLMAPLPGWDGERIVDTRSQNVRSIMTARIQTMKDLGCDGIEPDNTDSYTNTSSALNKTTALDYIQFLVTTAHAKGLAIALKNNGDLVESKLPNGQTVQQAHDFAIVEECYAYNECNAYSSFVSSGKAVFIVEYEKGPNCSDANSRNFDAYKMDLDLTGSRTPCRR